MIETSLYFGQSKPDGSVIKKDEWDRFKENQVSRIFPEGSTLFDAKGTWFDPVNQTLITERTHVIVCYYRRSKRKSNQIDSLVSIYRSVFQQQSVLRVDKKVRVTF